MAMRKGFLASLILVPFLAAPAWCAEAAAKAEVKKKLSVSMSASPRVGLAPASVLFTAKLVGGDDGERLYCPTLEWDWGDGTQSTTGGECADFVPGETKIDRVFDAEHEYGREGRPTVRLTLKKGEKTLSVNTLSLTIGRAARSDVSIR